jgi:hypothetical protein
VLLIILAILTVTLAAALWLAAVLLQGWLYNDLAPRLPLRALAGGFLLALFLTAWCAVYRADPGRFDTLFSFKTEALDGTATEFQSVRRVGKDEKKPVKYVKSGTDFVSVENQKVWKRSDADGMVVALLIPPKDGKGEPTRFNAQLQPDGNFPAGNVRYAEEKGPRYTDEGPSLGQVYRVRSFAILGNILANLIHAALWAVVLWVGMRFALGHAIGIGLAFWALTMIAVQPVLFGYVTR